MTPRSVHPFHCIRFLHLDSGLSTNRDLPTKHSPRDTGMVPLSVPYAPTLTVGRADSESQSLLSNGAWLFRAICPANAKIAECGSSQFSEFSVLSSQRQPSPTESPIASHAVPEHYQSYWRLVGALDRLDTPVPKPPNTVAMQSPGDSERLERRIVSKRHADLPGSHSKRVKLSPSVTSSCMEEGPSTLKAPSSNHGKGVDFKSPFPLAGFVVFVDTRMEAGTPTSEYWGGILRGLGAQVCTSPRVGWFWYWIVAAQVTKTFASACTHVVFHRGHKGTVKQYK